MLWKLFILFLTLPTLELLLLIYATRILSFPGTVTLIVLTGILGATLSRQQGTKALSQIRSSLAQGHVPTREVVDGFLILIAGIVLLTPGFITDAAGFMLLIPEFRALIRQLAVHSFHKHVRLKTPRRNRNRPAPGKSNDDGYIDVEGGPVDQS